MTTRIQPVFLMASTNVDILCSWCNRYDKDGRLMGKAVYHSAAQGCPGCACMSCEDGMRPCGQCIGCCAETHGLEDHPE